MKNIPTHLILKYKELVLNEILFHRIVYVLKDFFICSSEFLFLNILSKEVHVITWKRSKLASKNYLCIPFHLSSYNYSL